MSRLRDAINVTISIVLIAFIAVSLFRIASVLLQSTPLF